MSVLNTLFQVLERGNGLITLKTVGCETIKGGIEINSFVRILIWILFTNRIITTDEISLSDVRRRPAFRGADNLGSHSEKVQIHCTIT